MYALYRDAVGLIARYVGDGSSSNLQKSETVTCTVCDVHAVELRRGTETRIGTVASQSQLLRVRVSTCADAVNGTMKRGEGASWPAVGYHTKIDEVTTKVTLTALKTAWACRLTSPSSPKPPVR